VGAFLVLLTAAKYPHLATKVVLVGAPPFEERWVSSIAERRRGRLTPEKRAEFDSFVCRLDRGESETVHRLHQLTLEADSFDFAGDLYEEAEFQPALYHSIWPEVAELRRTGGLLARVSEYKGNVIAIHGDSDPHPALGVKEPLSRVLDHFSYYELGRCGHTPWAERQASAHFYELLAACI
jgi:pimeloyl-ACP methyl ester carboxylesterase